MAQVKIDRKKTTAGKEPSKPATFGAQGGKAGPVGDPSPTPVSFTVCPEDKD